MGKPDMIPQHQHKALDGRKDHYASQKVIDKTHHKSSSSSNKSDGRASKSHIISQIPGAIRVCGDWSEQLSSHGKLYFFNIKTKSSQWERPKEWSNSRAIDVKKEKSKLQHNRATSKHANDSSSHKSQKSGHSHGSDARKLQSQQHTRHRNNHDGHGKESRDRDYRTSNSNSQNVRDRDYRDLDYREKKSESRHAQNHSDSKSQSQDRDYRSSNSSQENKHAPSRQYSEVGAMQKKEHNGRHANNTEQSDGVQNKEGESGKDDKGKSNSSTPLSIQETSKSATSMEIDGAEGSASVNGTDGTSALVQTLSTVLNQASQSSVEDKTESASIEGNLKNALQMLLTAAAQSQQITSTSDKDDASKKEEVPTKRPRLADAMEERICRLVEISSTSGTVLEDLRSLYDERYTSHIQGWPADQMERQSVRLCDENHQFVVDHTSQLSSSMKISRSRVRSAEIHSTLQEQRILYLRQQVKDLEKSSTITPFTRDAG